MKNIDNMISFDNILKNNTNLQNLKKKVTFLIDQ